MSTLKELQINELPKRHLRMVEVAINVAKQSNMNYKHGCVANVGGKIIGTGFNDERSRIRKQNVCSQHAEVACLSCILRGTHQTKWREKAFQQSKSTS